MNTVLSLVMLTAIALVLGAIALWRRGGYRKQAGLMLLLAVIMAINLAIWTLPATGGKSLSAEEAARQAAPE